MDSLLENLENLEPDSLFKIKNFIIKNSSADWPYLHQHLDEILFLSKNSEDHLKSAIFILSQISIHNSKLSVISALLSIFSTSNNRIKQEIIQALTAIYEIQPSLHRQIHSSFPLNGLISSVGIQNMVDLIPLYCSSNLLYDEGRIILNFLVNQCINEENVKIMKTLNVLLKFNGFLGQYIRPDFLNYLLKNLKNIEKREEIIQILEFFIVNNEKSFAVLIPLKIFDYLLPLVNTESMVDVILLISNLAAESKEVVEMLMLNKGFEEIFLLLNKYGNPRLDREVAYLVHNAMTVASAEHVDYFVDIGVVQLLVNLAELVNEDTHRVIDRTLKMIKKFHKEIIY